MIHMSLEDKIQRHYQVPLGVRNLVIEQRIIGCFPVDYDKERLENANSGETKTALCLQVEKVVEMYAGQDANVLTILSYASEKGRLTEFLTLLEGQYTKGTTGYLLPELRMYAEASNMRRSQEFFMQCYADLGVEARDYVQIMQMTKGEQVRGVCEEYLRRLNVSGDTSIDA